MVQKRQNTLTQYHDWNDGLSYGIIADGRGGHRNFYRLENFEYVRTNQSWSRTTSKHITQWLEGVKAKTVEQSFLDNLLGA